MTAMLHAPRVRDEERTSLTALAAEVLALHDTKADYTVSTQRMGFTTEDGISTLSFDVPTGAALLGETPGHVAGPVNEHAHRQIGERLGIPRRYYTRMRDDAPTLLDQNVRHWFYNAPEKRLVRMLDGRVRAFLSDRYRRLDHVDLMAHAVLPTIAQFDGDLVFHVAAMTDERLTIRALLPGLGREVRVGDVVQAGIEIVNSEVGAGALRVAPFVWRLACRNGMVVNDRSLSRYHIGREQEEQAYAIYRDDTLAADDAAFFLKVRDAIAAALDEAEFDRTVQEMRAAAEGVRIEQPVAAAELLAQRFDLTATEGGTMLAHLAAGGDLSQWGAANAVTAAAKHADTFDRQREMEVVGGAVVALPAKEWAAIAAAR